MRDDIQKWMGRHIYSLFTLRVVVLRVTSSKTCIAYMSDWYSYPRYEEYSYCVCRPIDERSN